MAKVSCPSRCGIPPSSDLKGYEHNLLFVEDEIHTSFIMPTMWDSKNCWQNSIALVKDKIQTLNNGNKMQSNLTIFTRSCLRYITHKFIYDTLI